jgi:hypothetical protein
MAGALSRRIRARVVFPAPDIPGQSTPAPSGRMNAHEWAISPDPRAASANENAVSSDWSATTGPWGASP